MIPIKITLSGFMSYREPQTLNFDGASLWVLSGPNGAGKSAVFDAVTFALFGKYRGDHSTNYKDLVNHNSDRAVVEFDFAVGDKLYRIRRTINKKGNTTRGASALVCSSDGGQEKLIPIPGADSREGFEGWIENEIGLNFETFTSSVLLLQNKSDRLLEANTDQRYEVLSKLIDLSKYEALERRANDHKKSWFERAKLIREQLRNTPEVSPEELEAARQEIEEEKQTGEAAQAEVERLTTLFGQARHWEALQGELERVRLEQEKAQSLVERADEIDKGYKRWSELERVLPGLELAATFQNRINAADNEVERLKGILTGLDEPIRLAVASLDGLEKKVKGQSRTVEECCKTVLKLTRRKAELAPVLSLIDRVESEENKQDELQRALDGFPPDLDGQLAQADVDLERAREARQSLPWLENLADKRGHLRQATNQRDLAEGQIGDLQKQTDKLRPDLERASHEVENAQKEETSCRDALSQAEARRDEAANHARRFDDVAGEQVCHYCGSELTPEHKERERKRIQQQKRKREAEHQSALTDYQAASERLIQAKKHLQDLSEQMSRNNAALEKLKDRLVQAEEKIKRLQAELEEAYENLAEDYRILVTPTISGPPGSWLAIVYPDKENLGEVRKLAKEVNNYQEEANRLHRLQGQRKEVEASLKTVEESLEADHRKLPDGWEQTRTEGEEIEANLGDASASQQAAEEELASLETNRKMAEDDVTALRNQESDCKTNLDRQHAKRDEAIQSLEDQIEQLPNGWRGFARTLTAEALLNLQSERDHLAMYEHQYQELIATKDLVGRIEETVRDLEGKINGLPEEARQPAECIEERLKLAQGEKDQAERRMAEAEGQLALLEDRQKQRDELEGQLRNADRKRHLYGILAEQLGDQGIQIILINRAELAITNLASERLENLSAGRWRLELREQGRNKKALDLLVYDKKTGGDTPIPIVLASGSQRFRIAISLALAIGEYIRRESRRIESVIIDEGFGSLDKTGRVDAIQELQNLRQHLERIILVSHQEEFYSPFTTGYAIDIIDGASQVKLLER